MTAVTYLNAAAYSSADEVSATPATFQEALDRASAAPLSGRAGTRAEPVSASAPEAGDESALGIADGLSRLYMQNGVLKVLNGVLDRVAAAEELAFDSSAKARDVAGYNAALHAIQKRITSISEGKYNEHEIFGTGDLSLGERVKFDRMPLVPSDASRFADEKDADKLHASVVLASAALSSSREELEKETDRIADGDSAERNTKSWIRGVLDRVVDGLRMQDSLNSHRVLRLVAG